MKSACKDLRKNLKTFPTNDPRKTELRSEIEDVKAKLKNQKVNLEKVDNSNPLVTSEKPSEAMADIFGSSQIEHFDLGTKLLGELLSYLRKNKKMSALMHCRQIKTIAVSDGIAELSGDDDSLAELETNEKLHEVVAEFFEGKHLKFKVKEKVNMNKDLDELKSLLGSKLKII